MKTHTTTTLQRLVLNQMSPKNPAMSNQEIEDWILQIPEITEDMGTLMSCTVFGFFADKLTYRHLGQILKECTLMLDALYGYPDCKRNMEKLYQMVLDCLLGIIESLHLHYNKYLDMNTAMPIILYRKASQQIEANAELMVTAMTRYHADKRLQALVVGKMTGLLKKGGGSWHQIRYLERLNRCIMELCTGSNSNVTARLRSLLLRANFNTSAFIAYCKERIDEELAENFEIRDQFKCLFIYQREFSSKSYMHKFLRFEPRQLKVNEVLLQHVNSEISLIDRKRSLITVPEVVINPALQQHYRLPVSISVDILAYFLKLLLTAGVVISSKRELLLFISRNFSTPKSGMGDISLQSVDGKYRQVVEKTAITVKSILSKMLKQLNEEFN